MRAKAGSEVNAAVLILVAMLAWPFAAAASCPAFPGPPTDRSSGQLATTVMAPLKPVPQPSRHIPLPGGALNGVRIRMSRDRGGAQGHILRPRLVAPRYEMLLSRIVLLFRCGSDMTGDVLLEVGDMLMSTGHYYLAREGRPRPGH